jgi:hypothetical protein
MKTIKSNPGLFLLIFICSCVQDLKPDEILKKENDFKLTIHQQGKYTSDSTIVKTINKDSEKIIKLKNWITNNPADWKSSVDSWVTPDISLTGKDFRLLIFKSFAVIGFKDKTGKLRQYTKQVDKSAFDFLIENK